MLIVNELDGFIPARRGGGKSAVSKCEGRERDKKDGPRIELKENRLDLRPVEQEGSDQSRSDAEVIDDQIQSVRGAEPS